MTRRVWAVLAVGFLLRIAVAWIFWGVPLSEGGDDRHYADLAASLLGGEGLSFDGFQSAYRMPLFPLLLALCGADPDVTRILLATLGSITPLLVFWTARAAFGEKEALLAAAAAAFLPEQILTASSLHVETLFTLTIMAAVFLGVRAADEGGASAEIGFGAASAISWLTRSTASVLIVPLAFLRPRKGLILAAWTMAVVLSPWAVRNFHAVGSPALHEVGVAGPPVWYAATGWDRAPESMDSVEPMTTMYRILPHTDWDSFALKRAWKVIAKDPVRYALGCIRRAAYMLYDGTTPYHLRRHPAMQQALEDSDALWESVAWVDRVLRLGLYGLSFLLLIKDPSRIGLVLAACAALPLVHSAGTVTARYAVATQPIWCILAAAGFYRIYRK